MRSFVLLSSLFTCFVGSGAQQIYDIYSTTWNRNSLFTYQNLGSNPINFASPGADGQATISISDTTVYQQINGFGATLTDTSASSFLALKNANNAAYWELIHTLFDPTDSDAYAGLSFIRVTLAASDLSSNVYSFDDTWDDSSLSSFSTSKAANIISVLKDIRGVNSILQVHLVPWSPPAWMKTSNSMLGGGIQSSYYSNYASYLQKAVTNFKNSLGFTPYSIGVQNEPQNGDGSYPTCTMSVDDMGHIGTSLRSLLNSNGLSSVKIIGYEHNWDNAAAYPVQLMQKYGSAFSGVAFHCYAGAYTQQGSFTSAFPNKEVYQTECTGTQGSDWWTDIKWFMDNLFIGSLEYSAKTAMMWNLAADENGGPILSGTDSCNGGNPGCRPVVTISGGSYTLNQEFYAMAQVQKAVLPKDVGGPMGKRIGVNVGGNEGWALRVGAYVTGRKSSTDWYRYSIVVLNWDDSSSTSWNPQAVQATINFRGMQASYTFPVGVTTMFWYASPSGYERRANGTVASAVVRENVPETVHVEHAGQALPPAHFVPVPTREGEAAKPASNATTNATTAAVPQSHKAARHRLQRSRLDSSN